MTPVVIVGHGIAGMAAALAIAERGQDVVIVCRQHGDTSNSTLAQGGIAAALGQEDAPELHAADTLEVGRGLSYPKAVQVLTQEAPEALAPLIASGTFVMNDDGTPKFGREAGHSRSRILHASGGMTGRAVAKWLDARVLAHPRIRSEVGTVLALATDAGRVVGIWMTIPGEGPTYIPASAVVLATGGYAGLFARSTNPPSTRGDGLRLAYEVGAVLADLEFVQFHPTVLAVGPERPAVLLSEALRGRGARVVDASGRSIVEALPGGPLAPRDILARTIWQHWQTRGPVYLSLRHLPIEQVREEFSDLAAVLKPLGLDLARDLIPVRPAAHFTMGGIVTDLYGRTTVPGLYAVGECAVTGVHGANRLASNSLLEGLVFGRRVAEALSAEPVADRAPSPPPPLPQDWPDRLASRLDRDFGVQRSGEGLDRLATALRDADAEIGEVTLASIVRMAVEAALARRETRGAHARTDYPETDPALRGHFCHQRDRGMWFVPHHDQGGLYDDVVHAHIGS
jgi:L-aspartate oxidase